MIERRSFLKMAAGVGASLLAPRLSGFAQLAPGADSQIDVLANETLGTIAPEIYGHFVEHLGAVVYNGVWVGEQSKIRNVGGLRQELVESLRQIHSPVIRWPGGCFADSYDWKDGIGPRDRRPRRTGFWSDDPKFVETNEFGTDEFMRFCKLTGSQPYLAVNLRSLPAEDFYRWIEYCNSPANSTSLAAQREANGARDPYGVRYWGVGNESWGCGGNFTAEEYAVEFRRYATWFPRFGVDMALVASGPSSDDVNWTQKFFEKLVEKDPGQLGSIHGLSLHHYAWNLSYGKSTDWDAAKGDAVKFDAQEWYELMREGARLEPMIQDHWKIMGQFDRKHRIKLFVDEWGPWYKPGSTATGHLLEQMITLRDAVMSGLTLNIFNRHPEKAGMANTAQLVNCLNSLFLTDGDKFLRTPVYHVFDMYKDHMGGSAVRTVESAPEITYTRAGSAAHFPGLQSSGSIRGKELMLTVVNASLDAPRETQISLRGVSAKSATATVLTSADMHDRNTFADPDAVAPKASSVAATGNRFRYVFPAKSVTQLRVQLA